MHNHQTKNLEVDRWGVFQTVFWPILSGSYYRGQCWLEGKKEVAAHWYLLPTFGMRTGFSISLSLGSRWKSLKPLWEINKIFFNLRERWRSLLMHWYHLPTSKMRTEDHAEKLILKKIGDVLLTSGIEGVFQLFSILTHCEFILKHCQRHYGPRCWLLWPVILVW